MTHIVDLTQTISDGDSVWPGDPPCTVVPWKDSSAGPFQLNVLSIGEHTGTHLGAPCHYGYDGSIDDFPISLMHGRVAVLRLDQHPWLFSKIDSAISGDAIQLLFGEWPIHTLAVEVDMVLIVTGWANHWGSIDYYTNDKHPVPGLKADAIDIICSSTGCSIVGIDGPNIDFGGAPGRVDCGIELARRGMYHLENVALVPDDISGIYSYLLAPLKIGKGTGSPCRFAVYR